MAALYLTKCISIGYSRVKLFGLLDHALDFCYRGHAVAQALGVVYLDEFRLQIGSHTVAQLLDGIDPGCLEQLGKLSGHTLDTEQIGVISPLENEFGADPCRLGNFIAAFLRGTPIQQLLGSGYTRLPELVGIGLTYPFDFVDFVAHNFLFW